ncbi:MAG: nucleotidyltransferase domain-containing protein, partial [Candidatus Hodarchaeales archaeon]
TLKGRIEALRRYLPISQIVLFGSYASNNYTVRSDIDLLIICRTELNDAFERAKKAIAISGVQPHIYTESEYLEMKETIDRMIHGGIVLFEE